MLYYVSLVNFDTDLLDMAQSRFVTWLANFLDSHMHQDEDYWLIMEKGAIQKRHFHGFFRGSNTPHFIERMRFQLSGVCVPYIEVPRMRSTDVTREISHYRWYNYCMKDFYWIANEYTYQEIFSNRAFQRYIHNNGLTWWVPEI